MGAAALDLPAEITVMITILKLLAAAGIALGLLSPSFIPGANDAECQCKADTKTAHLAPKADADCACKADVD